MERDVLLTAKEVSAWLGLSLSMLANMRASGKGPIYLQPTVRRVRYRERDVQAWLDASAKTRISA